MEELEQNRESYLINYSSNRFERYVLLCSNLSLSKFPLCLRIHCAADPTKDKIVLTLNGFSLRFKNYPKKKRGICTQKQCSQKQDLVKKKKKTNFVVYDNTIRQQFCDVLLFGRLF
ncbi:hypothetical protein RFI_19650 [Reticulomyxa filosa]|uniref:Uncharacterized protein n=1 Tax=Reticulomyxa filosa TaxID=46433 RepID=X6MX52_RETFI|nr:hypothetical protein RFI_19650 [Reticulomyxa filosa]|eukprot:ETO17670.1 hypothetical protein RFI_19650 [Reticulomyxa filosa]